MDIQDQKDTILIVDDIEMNREILDCLVMVWMLLTTPGTMLTRLWPYCLISPCR